MLVKLDNIRPGDLIVTDDHRRYGDPWLVISIVPGTARDSVLLYDDDYLRYFYVTLVSGTYQLVRDVPLPAGFMVERINANDA